MNKAKGKLLLLEDVKNLGRKGDLVVAKRGFVRNFLIPTEKAVVADKRTLRWQERLQEERAAQAEKDKEASLALSKKLETERFCIEVKIDIRGYLFGSVSSQDVVKLLSEKDFVDLERRQVLLVKSIKKIGVYTIGLTLKENVGATMTLQVGTTKQIEDVQEKERLDAEEEKAAAESPEDAGEELDSKEVLEKKAEEEIDERTKS
ncbi:50S ribosomal protein L9 [Candidatus Aerophobetes bacterium]|uniref:Large ribosomal subunit protein bL9 n=1 Tax=Aerophobetes bacterium TaxID=2030807 RepID=A0A2A4X778_UNCAE|nr:MAG: 50S ribosomal protein L9 [Candidatus Aerophobetes bacterium]